MNLEEELNKLKIGDSYKYCDKYISQEYIWNKIPGGYLVTTYCTVKVYKPYSTKNSEITYLSLLGGTTNISIPYVMINTSEEYVYRPISTIFIPNNQQNNFII